MNKYKVKYSAKHLLVSDEKLFFFERENIKDIIDIIGIIKLTESRVILLQNSISMIDWNSIIFWLKTV